MKMQYCFNCGAPLGQYRSWPGDIECCGLPECVREERNAYREQQDEREERAREDDYNRY